MDNKEKYLKELADNVMNMEEDLVIDVANKYVAEGYDAYEGIAEGLSVGMDKAGKLYEEEEYYIPELLMCSDAMYAGVEILKPHLKKDTKNTYKAVVGVVEGDTHDIGKNLFKIMLETAGYEVYDLGRDVPAADFVAKVKETGAKVVGLSTLMTTTMGNMGVVIDMLKNEGIRDDVVVMVGGGPISQKFAEKIGADGYAPEASKAVKLASELIKEKNL